MPTVLRIGPYKFYLYPHDVLYEPPHIHVGRDRDKAKFWLDPVELERNRGFAGHELRKIEGLVREHESELIRLERCRRPSNVNRASRGRCSKTSWTVPASAG